MAPLPQEHEDQVNEIVGREVERFAKLLEAEIERTPLRADGAMNARDLYACVVDARVAYEKGETP